MAGPSNDKFQDTEKEGFVYVEGLPKPNNRLLKSYESLQCELELDYEVLNVAELSEAGQFKENNREKWRLDHITGTCWSDYVLNIFRYSKRRGHYCILSKLCLFGTVRSQLSDTNRKMVENFLIEEGCEVNKINLQRLGHTPNEQTTWSEVNIALAEATSLLVILSDKIKLKFKRYLPVPQSSNAFIIALSDQRILPLHAEGKFNQFKSKEFDEALVAFLDCISQLNVAIKKTTPNYNIPHAIERDKIKDPVTDGQYTVKLRKADDCRLWSRAMKLMLNNMEFLMRWVVLYAHQLEEPPLPPPMNVFKKTN